MWYKKFWEQNVTLENFTNPKIQCKTVWEILVIGKNF